jgi:hypothetical protein
VHVSNKQQKPRYLAFSQISDVFVVEETRSAGKNPVAFLASFYLWMESGQNTP